MAGGGSVSLLGADEGVAEGIASAALTVPDAETGLATATSGGALGFTARIVSPVTTTTTARKAPTLKANRRERLRGVSTVRVCVPAAISVILLSPCGRGERLALSLSNG